MYLNILFFNIIYKINKYKIPFFINIIITLNKIVVNIIYTYIDNKCFEKFN